MVRRPTATVDLCNSPYLGADPSIQDPSTVNCVTTVKGQTSTVKHIQISTNIAIWKFSRSGDTNPRNVSVIIHLPLAHFPPTFLTHLPPVNEPFTPYV